MAVRLGKHFDLYLTVLGVVAAQVSILASPIGRFWKVFFLVILELDDRALRTVDQACGRINIREQHDALTLLQLQMPFVARFFLSIKVSLARVVVVYRLTHHCSQSAVFLSIFTLGQTLIAAISL